MQNPQKHFCNYNKWKNSELRTYGDTRIIQQCSKSSVIEWQDAYQNWQHFTSKKYYALGLKPQEKDVPCKLYHAFKILKSWLNQYFMQTINYFTLWWVLRFIYNNSNAWPELDYQGSIENLLSDGSSCLQFEIIWLLLILSPKCLWSYLPYCASVSKQRCLLQVLPVDLVVKL